jgi:hypothetical protein
VGHRGLPSTNGGALARAARAPTDLHRRRHPRSLCATSQGFLRRPRCQGHPCKPAFYRTIPPCPTLACTCHPWNVRPSAVLEQILFAATYSLFRAWFSHEPAVLNAWTVCFPAHVSEIFAGPLGTCARGQSVAPRSCAWTASTRPIHPADPRPMVAS